MGLVAFRDHVIADFAADSVTAVVSLGKDRVMRHDDPTPGRVVFVPKTFRILPLEGRVGGNPRPVARVAQVVEVRVWARGAAQADPDDQPEADVTAVEALTGRTVLAIHRWAEQRSAVEGDGEYIGEIKTLEFGAETVFTTSLDFDVLDAPWSVETGVSGAHTGAMILPAGDYPGCGG